MSEIPLLNGHMLLVRRCDSDDDCVVIEKHIGLCEESAEFREVDYEPDPLEELHIPADGLDDLIAELKRLAPAAKAAQKEPDDDDLGS